MSEHTIKRLYAGAGMATLYKNGVEYTRVTVPMATAASSEADAIGEMVKMSIERFPFADGYGNHGAVAVCIPDDIITRAYQLINERRVGGEGKKMETQMKPDWKDAPEWAQWLAMDYDGKWYWYENEPILRSVTWRSQGGHMRDAIPCVTTWDKSLEQRP